MAANKRNSGKGQSSTSSKATAKVAAAKKEQQPKPSERANSKAVRAQPARTSKASQNRSEPGVVESEPRLTTSKGLGTAHRAAPKSRNPSKDDLTDGIGAPAARAVHEGLPAIADNSRDRAILECLCREQQPVLFFVAFPRIAIILKRKAHEAKARVKAIEASGEFKKRVIRAKDEVLVNKKRLEARLKPLKLEQAHMENDGNCQFRAFAHQLFGSEKYHSIVRQKCVQHLQSERDAFMIFFSSPDEFDSYIKSQSRDRTWGDEITLKAMCDTFGVVVHVITSTDQNWHLEYQPEQQGINKKVFISYISPVHYNSLVLSSKPPKPLPAKKRKYSVAFGQ